MLRTKSLLVALGVGLLLPQLAQAQTNNFQKSYSGDVSGNNHFDAGYNLGYGYKHSKSSTTAKASANGRVGGWVKLFGQRFDVVEVRAEAGGKVQKSNPTCSANIKYETFLLGIKVPSASGDKSGGTYANKTLFSRSQKVTREVTVPMVSIGAATLYFRAWAHASEYLKFNGTAWCNSVSAELRPGANISGTGQFDIDIAGVVSAGLRGTLSLLDTSVPASVTAGWSFRPEPDFFGDGICSWTGTIGAEADVEVIPVSGKFEVFARVGLPCTNVFGLLPGKGICLSKEWTHTLYEQSFGKLTFELESDPQAIVIGEYTTTCPPNPGTPPNR
ncbi:hypothetical protein [Haliangium sp.]|uniref:hypothetical protein n=1 Tax=Haliangium sp. TaxID=2663208 RepID=UPI003D0FDC6C